MADDKDKKDKGGLKLIENRPQKDTMKLTGDAPAETTKTRMLSELESARVDLVNAQQQKAELEKKLLTAQEAMIGLRRENFELRMKLEGQDHEKLFDSLGLKGKSVNLNRNNEGRYEVTEKSGG